MIRRIGLLPAITLAFAILTPGAVSAHAELTSTTPADGDELGAPPAEVVMTFGGELDPAGSSFVVTDADGTEVGSGEVDLEVAERNVIRGAVEITEPGEYTVTWQSAAADGHPEEGAFTFTVAGDDGDGGTDGTPDTALHASVDGMATSTWIGLVLLGSATVLFIRRLAGSRA